MAYNRGSNPDALPAHVEPEQAAQMMYRNPAQAPPRQPSYSSRLPPQQPSAQTLRTDDTRYSRPPQQPAQSYGSAPPPQPSYNAGPSYGDSRQQSQRFGEYPRQPATYGTGPPPPPPSGYHNRPPIPQNARPPQTPAPPRDASDREALWPLFLAVDKDRSGQLSESELRRALVNGDYTAFDTHTVKMMIRMFDADRSGTINFDEFCGLWGFLAAWRQLFDRFDVDRSGHISLREFEDALVAFGYRLSPQFVQLLFSTYARNVGGRGDDGVGSRGRERGLSFDLFVQACISLKRMTDVFKRYDEDRDGYITLSL
ncbi:hypothetical protein LTR28_001995 [Elasticomyces elasticus]|nr:hypothetical protein LTR28_001995 [Elasticomyces elasticus]